VVGLPEVAVKDMSGKYLENQDLYPDVIVYQTPEERLKDDDVQLKKTIDTLLGK
jgi:C-terminal processing protease CtpA/Prc